MVFLPLPQKQGSCYCVMWCWLQYSYWVTQIQLLSQGYIIWPAVVLMLVCELLGSLNTQLQREAGH